jgi:hypothetical protein
VASGNQVKRLAGQAAFSKRLSKRTAVEAAVKRFNQVFRVGHHAEHVAARL